MLIKDISFSGFFRAALLLFVILLFIYQYPRYLIHTLGEHNVWISYFYTYGVGIVIFVSSLLWIFTRKSSVGRRKQENVWLIIICFGLCFSFTFHGLWILLALLFPSLA